jgi:retron-type reverse transcriptase
MKIITKIMANRLAPRMNEIISSAQNAFIQNRSIHDNFLYVQRMIMNLHKKGNPALFAKLDISKAFDTLNWAYLLDVLRACGFSQKWRNWVADILGSSSLRIIINGQRSNAIKHRRGVRQGDPLLPFLFILAMDPLYRMIDKAADERMLDMFCLEGPSCGALSTRMTRVCSLKQTNQTWRC